VGGAHKYVDGVCEACGQLEPELDSESDDFLLDENSTGTVRGNPFFVVGDDYVADKAVCMANDDGQHLLREGQCLDCYLVMSRPQTAEGDNMFVYCPATVGEACDYEDNLKCKLCLQPKVAVSARLGNTCEGNIGGNHEIKNGRCPHCHLTLDELVAEKSLAQSQRVANAAHAANTSMFIGLPKDDDEDAVSGQVLQQESYEREADEESLPDYDADQGSKPLESLEQTPRDQQDALKVLNVRSFDTDDEEESEDDGYLAPMADADSLDGVGEDGPVSPADEFAVDGTGSELNEPNLDEMLALQLCPSTLVGREELNRRKDNLVIHLSRGLTTSEQLRTLDVDMGENCSGLCWQQKQLLLSALTKGSNNCFSWLTHHGEPVVLDFESSITHPNPDPATEPTAQVVWDDKETSDLTENALAAKMAGHRLVAATN
jgi:hypothetical protein